MDLEPKPGKLYHIPLYTNYFLYHFHCIIKIHFAIEVKVDYNRYVSQVYIIHFHAV